MTETTEKETMVAGEVFEVTFETLVDGVPEDITDYAAKIQMRQDAPTGRLIQSWNDSAAELSRVNAEGKVILSLLPEATNAYAFKTAYMDLLLLKSDGGRRSAVLCIEFDRGVTR